MPIALTRSDAAASLSRLARMDLADALQMNGFGSALCSARYRLMAAWRWTIERKLPRRMGRRVSVEKKFSTTFSHEPDVGVKCASWWWHCMQRAITVPSSTLSAANSVVVPCRLSSWVIVPQRPGFNGSPGWVQGEHHAGTPCMFSLPVAIRRDGLQGGPYPICSRSSRMFVPRAKSRTPVNRCYSPE